MSLEGYVVNHGEDKEFPRAIRTLLISEKGLREITEDRARGNANIPDHVKTFRLVKHPTGRDVWLVMVSRQDWEIDQERTYASKRCPLWWFFAFNGTGFLFCLLCSYQAFIQAWYVGQTTSIVTKPFQGFWIIMAIATPISLIIMTAGFIRYRFPAREDMYAEHHIE